MKKLGVIGFPIGHSISPAFQQEALDRAGIDAEYRAYEVPPRELSGFVDKLRVPEWLGINVTIPHKQEVFRLMDELSPEAKMIGAVNTVVNTSGALYGHNTDAAGFLRALADAGFDPAGARVVVLGTGGAARAIVVALTQANAESITVAGRSTEKAAQLANEIREASGVVVGSASLDSRLSSSLSGTDLLVNATSVGMKGDPAEGKSPVEANALHSDMAVFDAVYNPLRTPLIEAAERAGARAVSGLDMLVCQGAESFELWTGVNAPVDVMNEAARNAMEV